MSSSPRWLYSRTQTKVARPRSSVPWNGTVLCGMSTSRHASEKSRRMRRMRLPSGSRRRISRLVEARLSCVHSVCEVAHVSSVPHWPLPVHKRSRARLHELQTISRTMVLRNMRKRSRTRPQLVQLFVARKPISMMVCPANSPYSDCGTFAPRAAMCMARAGG